MPINVSKWSARSALAAAVDTNDEALVLEYGTGPRFRLAREEDYFYATIRSAGKFEHVKVLRVAGDTLHIVRGQDSTEAQSWPSGACIEVEWNPAQVCEFTRQCVLGQTPTTVAPGTYCLDCNTCITIGSDGRITAVDGEKKCTD